MTMLMQWLQVLVPAGILWLSVAATFLKDKSFFEQESTLVQFLILTPLFALIALGVYAAGTVIYKTLTFNDCVEASKELQKDIAEAKEFLKKNNLVD